MKLLVTLDFPPEIGGIQRYLFDIVRFTFSPEDRVLVGCTRKPAPPFRESYTNILWISSPLSFLNKKLSCIPLFFHLVKMLISHKNIQEIFCGNVYAGIVPWAASFFTHVHYSVYTHGTEILFLQRKTFRGRILKQILQKARLLYANSRFTVSLLKDAGIEKEVCVISPRVVIPEHAADIYGLPAKYGRPPENALPQILCVGRLVARKGFANALEALYLLPEDLPWHCVIVGNGPLAPSLRAICRARMIDRRVTFKSRLSDDELSGEFDRSTLFVLPGAKDGGVEGFGIVLIEAMSHRIPVIAGRTGAVSEVLDDGACGILVEPGDIVGLSREIYRLLDDGSLRMHLARSAFERVKRCYAW